MLKLGNSALIVEKEELARSSLRTQMEHLQVKEIVAVDSIYRAIKAVQDRVFDVILCGYEMKDGRTGQQFLEQARVERLIPHSRVFMMVTAHSYEEDVMAVAEWIPDDFIVRPFTPNDLYKRLAEATVKKYELRAILSAIDNEDFGTAIAECRKRLDSGETRYRRYVQRVEAETHLRMEEYAKAARCFESILSEKPAPWAELGLGKALLRLGESDRAKRLFQHVSQTCPNYVDSLDSLAGAHEAAGEDEEAQRIIARAVEKSPMRMDRMGKLGEIAARNGDFATAEKALSRIVSHGTGSCFHSPEAYLRLAEIAIAKGDTKKADSVLDSLNRSFPDAPEARFCLSIAKTDSLRKQGKTVESGLAFAEAAGLLEANPGAPYPKHALLRFAVECLAFDQIEKGESILRDICSNSNRRDALQQTALSYCPDAATKMKVRALFEEFEEEMRSLHEKGIALTREGKWDEAIRVATDAALRMRENPDAQLTAAQILLAFMEKHGWDDERFVSARKCLERGRELSPNHQRIRVIELLVDRVKKKFGIRSEPKMSVYEPPAAPAPATPKDVFEDDALEGIVLK